MSLCNSNCLPRSLRGACDPVGSHGQARTCARAVRLQIRRLCEGRRVSFLDLLSGYLTLAYRHCKRTSSPAPTPSPIFLTLLKLYLRPTIPNPPNLLSPALSLIARHSARLDPTETLQLLPPLVNAQDVRPFLVQSLRAPVFDDCVIREISLGRKEDVERQLMKLESSRVKVTDSRMCVGVLFLLFATLMTLGGIDFQMPAVS
jgi:hypothetical protein